MLSDLFKLFSQKQTLVSEARDEAIEMLDHGKLMFDIVMESLLKKPDGDVLEQIRHMDRAINEVQREVRRKVLEHLVFCRGQDLLDAIVLLTVVVDLERIGDYTKNIGELVIMMPEQCCWGKREDVVQKLRKKTLALFDNVRNAYANDSNADAKKAINDYVRIAKTCEDELRKIFKAASGEEFVPREFLQMTLILRYIKRVAGHLKNVATTVINPIDQIGFVKPESEE